MTKSKWMGLLFGAAFVAGLSVSHPAKLLAQVKATLIRSEDESGRNVYQETIAYRSFAFTDPSGKIPNLCPNGGVLITCTITFSPVPAGKRLVILAASDNMYVFEGTPGEAQPITTLDATASGQHGQEYLVHGPVGNTCTSGGSQCDQTYLMISGTRLYADAGTTPTLTINWFRATPQVGSASISGYYVDVP